MLQNARVEIDLSAIRHNLLHIRSIAGDHTSLLLPIKADAYGHGAVPVARYVERRGLADMFGVSSPAEGAELRDAGIRLPILVLGLILPDAESLEAILRYSLTQTVADESLAAALANEAVRRGMQAAVHLKIDTGMGRIGCTPERAPEIAGTIAGMTGARLEGVFTHFPVSDEPASPFTSRQIALFKSAVTRIREKGIDTGLVHAANSAAIFNFHDSFFSMIRPGIAAYGYSPAHGCPGGMEIIPSMTLKSRVMFVKRVAAGTPLSYGLTHTTARDTTIATVPVGYGDGYSRALSNRGKVIIRGKTYPLVGRVCMDQILVDMGDDFCKAGEEVVLFGRDTITAETIADMVGTIPYEVTCGISKRVPRVYIGDGEECPA